VAQSTGNQGSISDRSGLQDGNQKASQGRENRRQGGKGKGNKRDKTTKDKKKQTEY
jgi:hypothetical protein